MALLRERGVAFPRLAYAMHCRSIFEKTFESLPYFVSWRISENLNVLCAQSVNRDN